MKKFAFISLCLLFALAGGVKAQSMSDNQLVQYILQEKEKGTDQQVIIKNVLARGVTTEQLRRVRKKVEAEQKQLGAVDLTGKTQGQKSRLRTQRDIESDDRQKKQGFMIRSQRRPKTGAT